MQRLAPQPWMNAPATRAVMDALEAARPGGSRFVGGCVRNSLIGAPVDDVDIATTLAPQEVIAALAAAGLKHAPTGIAHGTVTAISGGKGFEVTTLRRDVATDGRRAVVAYTDDWAEDASRRDFRLNALYADPDGTLHDPVGGLEDARAGRIVFIGDADARIAEDYLRILRFFRFQAWYGRGPSDPEGLAACARGLAGLSRLSAERVWKELKKLAAAPDPRAAFRAMAASGVLGALIGEAEGLARLDGLVEIETGLLFEQDALLRLMALLPRDGAVADAFAARMKLSNAERERLCAWACDETRIVSYLTPKAVRQALYRVGPQVFADRVKLGWAESAAPRQAPQWRALLALAAGWVRPRFRLDGAMVQKAGVAPGPAVGAVLREVEEWWIDSDFLDDPLALIERLKAVAQALG